MLFRFIVLVFISNFVLVHCSSNSKSKSIHKGIRILFCGDVMLDWGIKDVFAKEGYEYPLSKLKDFLHSFNFRFCNLECPISNEGDPHSFKKYIFLAKPEAIKILQYGKINGVSLANNHANDFGEVALINTMKNLYNSGINFTGAGIDKGSAHLPISIDIKDVQIAIFGYSIIAYRTSFATDTTSGIAKADIELIRDDIQQYKRFYDFIIISLHWGDEYSDFPNEDQIVLAHEIIDSGADVIIGHHPHIYQGIEIYKNKPIVYSLGNFIFGSINEDIRDNIAVGIRFLKNRMHSLSVYPLNGNKNLQKTFQYKQLSGKDALKTIDHLIKISKPLGEKFVEGAKIKDSVLFFTFMKEGIKNEEL